MLLRMQKMAVEYNERIENVNSERKFHQQNTGGQLHALTIEWQELCKKKNIAIQAACVDLQNQIDQLKLEAKELCVHSLPPSHPLSSSTTQLHGGSKLCFLSNFSVLCAKFFFPLYILAVCQEKIIVFPHHD